MIQNDMHQNQMYDIKYKTNERNKNKNKPIIYIYKYINI